LLRGAWAAIAHFGDVTTKKLLPADRNHEVERAIARTIEWTTRERSITPAHTAMKREEWSTRAREERKLEPEACLQARSCTKARAFGLCEDSAELESERIDQQIEARNSKLFSCGPTRKKKRTNLDAERDDATWLALRSNERPIFVGSKETGGRQITKTKIRASTRPTRPDRHPRSASHG
jgi:hypothetical protein